VPFVKRSNSPSLIGTEAGRSMGSIGDALKSMGANAEAVVRVVETNVVSTGFPERGRIWDFNTGVLRVNRSTGKMSGRVVREAYSTCKFCLRSQRRLGWLL
jgi:hypothetical protein